MSARIARILASLPYFVAVAEELHFGRAAKRLGISQPPLSRRVRNLEKELNTPLFLRTRQQAVLTGAGMALLRHSSALIAGAEEAIKEIRRATREHATKLRIGFATSALYSVLPAVHEFSVAFPGIELSLYELTTDAQVAKLQHGQIDVGILYAPAKDRWLRTVPLMREQLIAAVPSRHRLSRRKAVPLADLCREPFVMYSRRVPRLRELIMSRCKAAGFQPNIVQEASQIPTMIAFVGASLGVALVPESARAAMGSNVRAVHLRGDLIEVELLIAVSRNSTSSVASAFVEVACNNALASEFTKHE